MSEVQLDLAEIHAALDAGRLRWSVHALARMMERGVSRESVADTIRNGEAIEHYPTDAPFPSVLIARITNNPLHVVIGYDSIDQEAHLITAYRPDTQHFEADLKTRRSRE